MKQRFVYGQAIRNQNSFDLLRLVTIAYIKSAIKGAIHGDETAGNALNKYALRVDREVPRKPRPVGGKLHSDIFLNNGFS